MLYHLNEENSSAKKKVIDEFEANVLEKKRKREIVEKSLSDIFDVKFDIMTLIRTEYSKNIIFQRIIKVKRENKRQILVDIIKTDFKLKLDNCNIKNDLF